MWYIRTTHERATGVSVDLKKKNSEEETDRRRKRDIDERLHLN